MKNDLIARLNDAAGLQLLALICSHHPALAGAVGWEQVAVIVNDQSVPANSRNSIINALLSYCRGNNCCYAMAALTLCFWRRLSYMSHRLQRNVEPVDDSLQSVLVAFYETISSSNFSHVSDLGGRIYSRTRSRVSKLFKKERRYFDRSSAVFRPERLPGHDDLARQDIDLADTFHATRAQLRSFVNEGILSSVDHALIERTRLEGASVNTVADELGITENAARSRRTRAERLLRDRGHELAIFRGLEA